MKYSAFLATKEVRKRSFGFDPIYTPEFLFDFQREITEWTIRTGRSAIFEDCGLGKTPQELVFAENVVRKFNKRVLILTPLAVAAQFVREGDKFGIEVHNARNGKIKKGINVVNYQQLHRFNPKDFVGVVSDESGCLKHHDAKTRKMVSDFTKGLDYVLLGTATPAPNDFMELGNSSEVLRVMSHKNMLAMYFTHDGKSSQRWSLLPHAKRRFWRWMSTWSRAVRKPSDIGYDDGKFVLPNLKYKQHLVNSRRPSFGFFVEEARTLEEQRQERRDTLKSRCEKVASLIPKDRPFITWCHLNVEGDLLTELIPDAVQVSGKDSDSDKESKLEDFGKGNIRVLVTKPKIAGFGLNWQHCSDASFFPSHSWEQWYQAVRRNWRFGQTREVTIHIVTSEAESRVLENMMRKERQADELYNGIIREMSEFQNIPNRRRKLRKKMRLPSWL